MTKYETDQIFKSGLQNEDDKTIAKRMSIKAKTIASYCYRNGLTDSNIDSIYHHVCAGCGTAFKTAGNKSQKYCSRQCYLNHRKGSVV